MGAESSSTYTNQYPQVYSNGKFILLGRYLINVSAVSFFRVEDDGSVCIRMIDNSSDDKGRGYTQFGIDEFRTAPLSREQREQLFTALNQ